MNIFLIYGLGVSGLGALNFLLKNAKTVYIYDDNKNKLEDVYNLYLNKYPNNIHKIDLKDFNIKADYLVCSPSVVFSKNDFIQAQIKKQTKLISDIDLVHKYDKEKLFFGITGTNGKSTSASLLSHILNNIGCKNSLGGNIGKNLLDDDVFGLKDTNYVIEVSSYQAELLNFNFDIAALTNITPDHIDHHGSFENYANTKINFVKSAKYKIVNRDDYLIDKSFDINDKSVFGFSVSKIIPSGISLIKESNGLNLYINKVQITNRSLFENLIGEHNLQNIACVLSFIYCIYEKYNLGNFIANIDKIFLSIDCFNGLSHRIEKVASIGKITFVNDSKATNVQSCEVALKCFDNIILLAGGVKKEEGLEYFFDKECFKKVLHIVCYGQCGSEFYDTLVKNNYIGIASLCLSLKDATLKAYSLAENFVLKENKVNINILLSPCTASFDEFKNFEQRGDVFKEIVNSIKK
jgi:UDP-N-acetylmuramoylalanine--D-glutamate ligase